MKFARYELLRVEIGYADASFPDCPLNDCERYECPLIVTLGSRMLKTTKVTLQSNGDSSGQ